MTREMIATRNDTHAQARFHGPAEKAAPCEAAEVKRRENRVNADDLSATRDAAIFSGFA